MKTNVCCVFTNQPQRSVKQFEPSLHTTFRNFMLIIDEPSPARHLRDFFATLTTSVMKSACSRFIGWILLHGSLFFFFFFDNGLWEEGNDSRVWGLNNLCGLPSSRMCIPRDELSLLAATWTNLWVLIMRDVFLN